jgi:hypothetical protein
MNTSYFFIIIVMLLDFSAMGRSAKTTWAQQGAMLDWLSIDSNFKLITGGAQKDMKGVIAGARLKKKDAFAAIADYVNQKCGTRWTVKEGESRFKSYLKMYKKTREAFSDTNGAKYCISLEDIKKGIPTIDAKLNDECYGYARMDL